MKGLRVLIQGQLGIELWTAEVVIDLRVEYPDLKLGIITPFMGISKWNEQNQMKYNKIAQKLILWKVYIIPNMKDHFNLNKQISYVRSYRYDYTYL